MDAQPHCATAQILIPAKINWVYIGGVVYDYVATDEEILHAGLLDSEQIPGDLFRSRTRRADSWASRRKDGRLNLSISADVAMLCDTAFKRFIGGLLSDSRLSLVKGENHVA